MGTVDAATRSESGDASLETDYRGALSLMMAAYAMRAEGGVASVISDAAPFPRSLGLGLGELCGRLLERYERLSALNRYAEDPIGPLEHLKLLALLHDRSAELR